MYVIKVQLDTGTTVDFNTINLIAGTKPQPVCLMFCDKNNTPIDLSDKLAFISGMTPNNYNIEYCAQGNSQAQAVITFNQAFTQAAGAYKWLYVGLRDLNGNLLDCVPASLTIQPNQLNTDLDVGSYRDDWQKFKSGLSDEVNSLDSSVSYAKSCADSAAHDLSSASSLIDSSCSYAKSYATSATNKAVSQAQDAVNEMNKNVQTAINGMSESVTNAMNNKTVQITNNSADIANIKGTLPTLLSTNLIPNSDLLTIKAGMNPYSDWQPATYWQYSDGTAIGHANWYGYLALQLSNVSNTNAALSQPVLAGYPTNNNSDMTYYSASFMYKKYGDFKDNNVISVYLEAAKSSDFSNSVKTLISSIDGSSDYGWKELSKANIAVSVDMPWIRLRVESVKKGCYIWLAHPMINRGAVCLPYVSSNIPPVYLPHSNLVDTNLMNGATGTIKVQQLGNTVTVNLIASNINSGNVVYQLPQQYRPSATQQAACVEANGNTEYVDFFSINTDGTIAVSQRRFDNASIPKIDLNATFQYFLK